jgi:hypothetical protein
MKYVIEALRLFKNKKNSYMLRLSVEDIKQMITNGLKVNKYIDEEVNNTLVSVKDHNVEWNEIELEMGNKSFFGMGFITLEVNDLSELIINYNDLELDDKEIISVELIAVYNR